MQKVMHEFILEDEMKKIYAGGRFEKGMLGLI